jgi:hypothetical protein
MTSTPNALGGSAWVGRPYWFKSRGSFHPEQDDEAGDETNHFMRNVFKTGLQQ